MPYTLPRYEFRRPPELDGYRGTHPVVIAGGGLTGLTLAADLGLRGVPVVLLDEDDTVGVRGASSRGICYARKSLEVFDRLGIAEKIREKGVTWSVGRTLSGDDEVYSFDLGTDSHSVFPPFVNIQQFHVEAFLVDRILRMPNVDLRWRSRVTGIDQDEDQVWFTAETPAGPYRLAAEWAIDATGAGSPIRDWLGLDSHPDLSADRWCISDIRFKDDRPPERLTWVDARFNEGRGVWLHMMADDVWRVDFQMSPDCDPAEVSRPEVVEARLRAMFGADLEFDVVWIGPYHYRSALVDRMRVGRVFLAGDAAHVVSPFGARGGNTGIQDAENLGWKLHQVLEGRADASILDSYHVERHSTAVRNLEVTRRSARFLAPRTAAERVVRDATLALARHHEFARLLVNTGRMSVPVPYPASQWLGDQGGLPVQSCAVGRSDGWRGSLMRLGRDGRCFLALAFSLDAAEIASIERDLAGLPVVVESVGGSLLDVDGGLAAQLAPEPGDIWILRPDLYVLARCVDSAQARHAVLAGLGRARQHPRSVESSTPSASPVATRPGLADPDRFTEEVVRAHENLTDDQSARLDAALVMVLANQIGDAEVLSQSIAAARRAITGAAEAEE
ncbi:FAD-dependent monooxygenase [Nocardia aurea]|uniref:FAD-dependent monooxygenase n=1 Tax=Nocardia aurea TaxID=2144174 RepID=UPI000D68807D|nr:FAD-dependent monooxygenase [Nocardia aurea]